MTNKQLEIWIIHLKKNKLIWMIILKSVEKNIPENYFIFKSVTVQWKYQECSTQVY